VARPAAARSQQQRSEKNRAAPDWPHASALPPPPVKDNT
jgi:hypothetical protein